MSSSSRRKYRVFLVTHLKEAEELGEAPTGIEIECYQIRVGGQGELAFTDYDGNYSIVFSSKVWAWFERV